MRKKKTAETDSTFFWNSASDYLNKELSNIRQKSPNTVETYRQALNKFVDYLEAEKAIRRRDICYQDFNKNNLKNYLVYMKDSQQLSEKTCNLRMTAIRSLLSYAAEESIDIMPIYVNAKTVKGLPVPQHEIEYFENNQLKKLLGAPPDNTRTGRRNRMILILGYDAGLRVSELLGLTVSSLHLDADVPYVSIKGKGSKYRNVPLMSKTVDHLNIYLKEFHPVKKVEMPLFYVSTHGVNHALSDDTVQNILKKYVDQCRFTIEMPEKVHFHMIRNPNFNKIQTFSIQLRFYQNFEC